MRTHWPTIFTLLMLGISLALLRNRCSMPRPSALYVRCSPLASTAGHARAFPSSYWSCCCRSRHGHDTHVLVRTPQLTASVLTKFSDADLAHVCAQPPRG